MPIASNYVRKGGSGSPRIPLEVDTFGRWRSASTSSRSRPWRKRRNSREPLIKLYDYIDAAVRQLLALKEGENCADDSGLPDTAHTMATMSIILHAGACGTLIDDRVQKRPHALDAVHLRILDNRRGRHERKTAT
ncbi:dATP/dGTP diphosphohydrolase domain-containing protein [Aurantimonas sp. HBX-1]|uniref:dATP/dGTP diphosphohydrolase domain-containing protein n=1 Tax=Aurantimonas sp. HBX-1 TaxID=2906072 RepID=UPI001F330DD6|nr:dATP/dGTP diphosphohydrolase domain-containing protein [Aurantimonas sp. HBX-1]UIJ74297.1 hypothetical protein LXB15_06865 [Aurantimonas sp. HBX-1]